MKRLLATLSGVIAVVVITTGYAFLHTLWYGLKPQDAEFVFLLCALGTAFCLVAFLAGQWSGIQSPVFYMVISGVVFLTVDVLVWLQLGIMPSHRVLRDGFIPASLMGVFLGPLYRVIALPPPPNRYLH